MQFKKPCPNYISQHNINEFRKKLTKNYIEFIWNKILNILEKQLKTKMESYIMFLNNVISDQMQYIVPLKHYFYKCNLIPRKSPTWSYLIVLM